MSRVLFPLEIITAGTARVGAAEKFTGMHRLIAVKTASAGLQPHAASLEFTVAQRGFAKAFFGVRGEIVEAHAVVSSGTASA